MLPLSSGFVWLIQAFAPIFDSRVWSYAQVLLVGVILAPGKRTVTSVLRIVGLAHEKHFQNYHRVLNRARWNSRAASRILLGLLVRTFAPAVRCWWDSMTPSSGAGGNGSRLVVSIGVQCAVPIPTW
jgi:DDE superfamily endonuclease